MLTWPDVINGLFEFFGSTGVWLNVVALHRDKQFRGVRIGPTALFASWGFWNLYYYPHLNQWLSFVGGLSIVAANTTWLLQMLYYQKMRTSGD